VGFLFSSDGIHVALIRKNKPQWQCGKLNGIGGKIEGEETPVQAMNREYLEEAGVADVPWVYRLILQNPNFTLHVFSAFDQKFREVKTMEDEVVGTYQVNNLPEEKTVDNLQWLIPLLMDTKSRNGFLGALSY
jgi:8-oxo-dGTP diphosphatase